MTKLVAQMAIATGISPVDLLETPRDIFDAMFHILQERGKDSHG